jgi:hypothetical protein
MAGTEPEEITIIGQKGEIDMMAKGWKGETLGVRVGTRNAIKHFSRDWKCVQVEIEGTIRSFPLRRGFWNTCPEIRGAAIQEWFLARGLAPWPKGSPPTLELTPLGGPLFRLATPNPPQGQGPTK